MVASPAVNHLTPEDYLEGEKKSFVKHEYVRGEVYAMAGASRTHITIAGNLYSRLRTHCRGTGCQAYIADMKVDIEAADVFYYPDVVVSCDNRDRQFDYFQRHPCLVVEVLSDSTERLDRGDKFANYRQLESLQEYVLVSQKQQSVELFRRDRDGYWKLYPHQGGDNIELTSIGFRCAIADLYEDVEFAPDEAEAKLN
ncbi:Uma2 family endonuclease [Synechococcus sp. PCC 7336]|uniref:Uma2 family endonuclease n=1 Tax=Synechococcus sp. PCC 7336 TaxID=195250 RepID=UPI00037975FC|nr:Uma2 family endonuclease [Synechococcus sp. PCC 7336]